MQIDQIQVVLRRRSLWETFDLGIQLWRHYFAALYSVWACVFLPVVLILSLASYYLEVEVIWLGLILWWLKPFLARVPLYRLSRLTFAEATPLRAILQESLGVRALSSRAILWLRKLLWARFSRRRLWSMSVDLLEKPSSLVLRRARLKVLGVGIGTPSFLMALLFQALEILSLFAVIGFFCMFVPTSVLAHYDVAQFFSERAWGEAILVAAYGVAIFLIEPIFVSLGFALYLSQRTHLEGWHIQLGFQNMLRRLQASRLLSFAALLIGVSLIFLTPQSAQAKELPSCLSFASAPAAVDEKDPQAQLAHLLKTPEFCTVHNVEKKELKPTPAWLERLLKWWRNLWKFDPPKEKPPKAPVFNLDEALVLFFLKGALITLAFGLVAWIAFHLFKIKLKYNPFAKKPVSLQVKTRSVAGLDVRPESLPTDVVAVAEKLFNEGNKRAALALLYRASLSALVHQHHILLRMSDTEADCLAKSNHLTIFPALQLLTQCWIALAYAAREPSALQFAEVCHVWRQHFSRPQVAA